MALSTSPYRGLQSVWMTPATYGLFLAFAVGCGRPAYETAPVAGTVTLDGQPFPGVKLMFAPVAKSTNGKAGSPGFGVVQADGSYTLGTYERGDGAVVGDHWITVIRLPLNDLPPDVQQQAKQNFADRRIQFERVKFPQRVSVAEGEENRIDVPLTREIIAKFGERD